LKTGWLAVRTNRLVGRCHDVMIVALLGSVVTAPERS
jgi:hypothetical protein